MNALPDFTMAFSSQRKNQTSPENSGGLDNAYRLDVTLSQKSDQAYSSARDESIRHVLEDSQLVSSHYRFKETQ